jgi:putative ABC transport system substrate-binding protein
VPRAIVAIGARLRARRRALAAIAVCAAALVAGTGARAADEPRMQKRMLIGRLSPLSASADARNLEMFRQGMQELGWREGRDYAIVARFADGRPERLPGLANELVKSGVDLIVTGSTPGALAAKRATKTIPIVMATTGDPVAEGIVASLSRPGGNVTGVTALGQVLNGKRLEAIKAAVPGATRIAVLAEADSPYTRSFAAERNAYTRALGIELRTYEVRTPGDFERAFAAMGKDRAGALLVLTDTMLVTQYAAIVALAAQHRLPAVYGTREYVDAGGLMFYGISLASMYHTAASYVDRILRGAAPGELPVEQPTKLELVVNLRTARAIGLTLPAAFTARVDQFIE